MKNRIYLLLVISSLLTACSPQTADEHLAKAEEYIAENKLDEAVIKLKNTLTLDRENTKARFYLGQLYLNSGLYLKAEKELERVFNSNYNVNTLLPLYAKLLFRLNKYDELNEVAEQYFDLNSESKQIVNFYHGWALTRSNNISIGKKVLNTVSEMNSESKYTYLAKGLVALTNTQFDQAQEFIKLSLNEDNKFIEAIYVNGIIEQRNRNYSISAEQFLILVNAVPNDRLYQIHLIQSLLSEKNYIQAEVYVNNFASRTPGHPLVYQFKGVLFYHKKDYKAASDMFEKAIQNGLPNIDNRLRASISYHQLGKLEQAYRHLNTIYKQLPPAHAGHKLRSMLQLQLGYTIEASQSLMGLEELEESDYNLFAVASYDFLKQGKNEQSKEMLDKFERSATVNAENLSKLGVLKLALGLSDGAIDIEKSISLGDSSTNNKISLALVYIQTKNYLKLNTLIEQWKIDEPNNVAPLNIEGLSYLQQKKPHDAELVFNKALKLLPSNPPSLLLLSEKHIATGDLLKASEVLHTLLESHPNYLVAIERYQRVQNSLGVTGDSVEFIKKAYKNNPDALKYKLLYAKLLIKDKKPKDVIQLLQNTTNVTNNTSDLYWLALGDSLSITGDNAGASKIYQNWLSTKPENILAHIRYISSLEKLRQWQGALVATDQALLVFSKNNILKSLKVNFLLHTNQPIKAQNILDTFDETERKKPLLQGLQGQIYLLTNKADKALPLLKHSYNITPITRNVTLVLSAMKSSGKDGQVNDFIIKHLTQTPKDNKMRILLADRLLEKQPDKALYHYQEALKYSPGNIHANNNLASIFYKKSEFKKAEAFAIKALDKKPNNAYILDTLGMIKLKLHEPKVALTLLKKAKDLATESIDISLHYIEALIVNDKKVEAKNLLNNINSEREDILLEVKRLRQLLQS